MSGGGGGTNTVQKSDPWAAQQPFLLDVFGRAGGLNALGPIPFYGEAGNLPDPLLEASPEPSVPQGFGGGSGFFGRGIRQALSSVAPQQTSPGVVANNPAWTNYLKSLQDPTTVQTLAPIPEQTTQALDMMQGAVPDINALASSGNWATQFGLNAPDISQNPFFQANVENTIRPMVNAFTDPGGVLNTVRDEFGNAGQYGSTRHQLATGVATGRLADAVGGTVADLGSRAYDSGLQAQSRALALLPTQQQSNLAGANALAQTGDFRRQLEQDFINEAIRRFQYSARAPYEQLAQYSNFIQGNFGGTATGSMETEGPSAINAALGGAALGAGAYAAGMLPASIALGPAAGIGALAMLAMTQL